MNGIQLHFFENEKKILRTVVKYKIQNIVELINVIKYPDTGIYYLVLEYCNGGSLHESLYKYINKYGKPFPENLVSYLMKQILLGLKCLHDLGIIHRDLKLGNILLKYKNDSDKDNLNIYSAEVKIIDFNSSYFPDNSEPKTFSGTIPNMAPSVINNFLAPQFPKSYDEKIDIWSLGTLCYEMLFGKPLFGYIQNMEMVQNIYYANFNIPNTISPQARSFLKCMLKKEDKDRLSCSQLLNHPFINEVYYGQYNGNILGAQTSNHNNKFINICFDKNGKKTVIVANANDTIQDIINSYFVKNRGNPGFINEYDKSRMRFLCKGEMLDRMSQKTIYEFFKSTIISITVLD